MFTKENEIQHIKEEIKKTEDLIKNKPPYPNGFEVLLGLIYIFIMIGGVFGIYTIINHLISGTTIPKAAFGITLAGIVVFLFAFKDDIPRLRKKLNKLEKKLEAAEKREYKRKKDEVQNQKQQTKELNLNREKIVEISPRMLYGHHNSISTSYDHEEKRWCCKVEVKIDSQIKRVNAPTYPYGEVIYEGMGKTSDGVTGDLKITWIIQNDLLDDLLDFMHNHNIPDFNSLGFIGKQTIDDAIDETIDLLETYFPKQLDGFNAPARKLLEYIDKEITLNTKDNIRVAKLIGLKENLYDIKWAEKFFLKANDLIEKEFDSSYYFREFKELYEVMNEYKYSENALEKVYAKAEQYARDDEDKKQLKQLSKINQSEEKIDLNKLYGDKIISGELDPTKVDFESFKKIYEDFNKGL